jgi:hypothetical protein
MKKYLISGLFLAFIFSPACQNDSDEPNIPLNIEILGSTPVSFITTTGQTIKFSIEDEIIYAKVLEIDNQLCPMDPCILCWNDGYLTGTFQLTDELESDTVLLRYGYHPYPDFWQVLNDSIRSTLSDKVYQLSFTQVQYYLGAHSDRERKLIFTMQLKKL